MDRNINAILYLSGIAVVALRKESVDRNRAVLAVVAASVGRSPQGERG